MGSPVVTTDGSVLWVFAPAKVNLALHVVGRRGDGYHLLDSLVVFVDVGDRIGVGPADRLVLTLTGPAGPSLAGEADNIVLRAARSLAEAAGIPARAAITLEKHLPVASGIGGGSTDAAATLLALARLWNVSLSESEMATLALRLGADVPVCLFRRPAIMTGIGDHVAPAPALPPAWLVLVNPGQPLSTPAVFRARAASAPAGTFSSPRPLTTSPADVHALAAALAERGNDLTEAACTLAPEIGTVLTALAARPGCLLARMSGSGATCFGLFADAAGAETAAAELRAEHPRWWTAAAALLAG
ncbi:MAG: 4-(cytidine 5'-diphospho)-2-C-methyl-D-erythritol kinase [Alphaproteobacteria bacterium]